MRGVSPIISTILMVAIAIAAAIIVYYVTMDVITKQGAELQQQAGQGQETFAIEEVDPANATNSTDANIYAYVRNLGDRDINITTAYIFNKDGTLNQMVNVSNGVVAAGQATKITVDLTSALSPGTTYTLKLVTANGASATRIFTTPSS